MKDQIEITLHSADLAVIGLYFILIIGISWFVYLRTKTDDDLFLAGRSLGWGVIGFSLFASNISATTLIGLSGAAFTTGIAVANYEWMAAVILIFMSFFVIPIFLRKQITTVPEWLEMRYSRACRQYFSALSVLMSVIVDTAGGIYAGTLVLQFFFPYLPLFETCFVIALFAGLYTAAGGLRAVVYTDVLQAIILLVGSCVLTYYVFAEYNFSWRALMDTVPADHMKLLQPIGDPYLPWTGTLVGVPILGFWYWATNQYITQRILGARDIQQARWGSMLASFLKLLPLFIMVMPGAMAIGLYEGQQIDDGDQIFPQLITDYLPIGLKGLVIAGLFSAIMSTIDSTLNSSSTLIIKDFVENEAVGRPLTPESAKKWGRITTLVLMLVAAVWAPQIANFKGLFAYLQQAFSIVVPPVAALFLLGLFTKKAKARAGLLTMILGHAMGIGFFIAAQQGQWSWHYTETVGLVTALSMMLLLILSHFEDTDVEDMSVIWTKDKSDPVDKSLPIWTDYRLHCVVLSVLMMAMLIYFG